MRIFWRGAAFFRVPFGGRSEQFAVGVAAGDVGDHGGRQGGGLVDFPAALGGRCRHRRVRAGCASARRGRHSSGRTRGRFSRVPILPGFARIKATMASRLGKPLFVLCLHLSPGLARALLRRRLGCSGGLRADVLAADATGARALLTASDFGFTAAFFPADFLAGFGASGSAALATAFFGAAFFAAAFLAPRFGLPPPLAARSSINAMASASGSSRTSCRSGSWR